MVLVQYVGESYFKFQVYNPYAVEIEYPVHIHACTKNLVCDDTYLDKLECIYYNNVRNNFACVHQMIVDAKHVLGTCFTEVNFKLIIYI